MIALATFRRGGWVCCLVLCALVAVIAVIDPASNNQLQDISRRIVTGNFHRLLLKPAGRGEFSAPTVAAIVHGSFFSIRLFPRRWQTQPQFSDSLRTQDIGKTQSMCVELLSDTGAPRSLPIDLGGKLRLSFRHSIYGSLVEELFTLRRDGFLLTQIRYGEARLVDFYGYENADLDNGAWVVNPPPLLLPSISLNTSAVGAMSLQLIRHDHTKPLAIQTTGALRLTLTSCRNNRG